MTATALTRRRVSGVSARLGSTVCVPMWVGVQAGRPHTPTNMVRGLGLVPGPRFLLTIHVLREEAMSVKLLAPAWKAAKHHGAKGEEK